MLLAASCAKPGERPLERRRPYMPPKKSAVMAQEKPKKQQETSPERTPGPIRIAIDPGHGGAETGAKLIIKPYTREKILNLKTAQKVEEFLSCWGYTTIMTRKGDVTVPLDRRVDIAKKEGCDLFVSIHYNSTPAPTTAKGVEIYYWDKTKDERSKNSRALAQSIIRRLVPAAHSSSRGVRSGDLCVIRETQMPAVLVECAFLSNPEEAKKLRSSQYINFLGWAIAKGIDDFIKKEHNVLGAN
jgi:N-acetylmuramoyl-L-alanine amidase